jgi:hypothetical protein
VTAPERRRELDFAAERRSPDRPAADLLAQLGEALAARHPGKSTLAERLAILEEALADAAAAPRERAIPASPSPEDPLAPHRATALAELVARLHQLPGSAALRDAVASQARRATLPPRASLTGREPPPDPVGRALWGAAERRAVTLYRRALPGEAAPADPAVAAALHRIGAGQPLPAAARAPLERALGTSLAAVRIHTDDVAAAAALAVRAAAFTVGEDIFFAAGAFAPDTPDGARLLAHEIAHVVQAWQGRARPPDAAGEPAVAVAAPDDDLERDAEATADRLTAAAPTPPTPPAPPAAAPAAPELAAPIAQLAAGAAAGADAPLPHLEQIAAAFGDHDVARIRVATGGTAAAAARALGAHAFAFGETIAAAGPLDLRAAAHEAAHVVQQRAGLALPGGMSTPGDASEREADAVADAVARGASAAPILDGIRARGGGTARASVQRIIDVMHPEDCPTFELWMAQFRDLPTFGATDGEATSAGPGRGHRVLGERAPRAGDDPRVDASPDAPHGTHAPTAGDRFIDHPTDAWVVANLPAELRVTAYQLPTDCADVAAILRHVWLTAHGRSERYTLRVRGGTRRITLGAGLGRTVGARRAALRGEIAGGRGGRGLSSASAAALVMQYRDASGAPVLGWDGLARRLHPGDIVVWEHREVRDDRAYGGHVQTVAAVERDPSGAVTAVRFVAGNQPLGEREARAIRDRNPEEASDPDMRESALRNAPGRRLELQSAANLAAVGAGPEPARWGWRHTGRRAGIDAYTVAIAVGPPSAVAAPRRAGAAVRTADWLPRLAAVRDAHALEATLEAALQEARAAIEGGDPVAAADLRALGEAAAAAADRVARHARPPRRGGAGATPSAAALRARLAAVTEALAPEPGSAIDAALHGAGPSGAHARGPSDAAVRAAFAPVRAALAALPLSTPTPTPTDATAAATGEGAGLSGWRDRLAAAPDQAHLDEVWAQALAAAVAAADAGPLDPAEVIALARAAGERVWRLATERAARGDRNASHYTAIYAMRRAVADQAATATATARAALTAIDRELDFAARGGTAIDWSRAPEPAELQDVPIRRVLVTGFDPFTGEPGTAWNPSGAAAIALDGRSLAVGGEVVAIEAVVYPVSFQQFGEGIVERVVAEHADSVDAIITVSMDPRLDRGEPVDLERYAVGVHAASELTPHPLRGPEPMATELVRIPRRGADGSAPPVIDAAARAGGPPTDLEGIAGDAGATVGTDLVLGFPSDAEALRAEVALGAHAERADPRRYGPRALRIIDPATAAAIVRDTAGDFDGAAAASARPTIAFELAGDPFTADLLAGPGGSFLSNEVAYRTQRELTAAGSSATSFHVHTTNESTELPELIAALERIITATITRRQAAGPARSGARTSRRGP